MSLQVPVPHKVFKTNLVPSTVHLTDVQSVFKDVVVNRFFPKFVTTTEVIPQADYITDYQVEYHTDYQTVFVTKNEIVPKYVTQTYYDNVLKTNVLYETVYKTTVVPQYTTTYQVVYETVYKTQLFPEYKTVYDTKRVVQTVCPTPGYEY